MSGTEFIENAIRDMHEGKFKETELWIFIAKIRILEQVRDDLADQVRKLNTDKDRLIQALERHHCQDPKFHLRTREQIDALQKVESAIKRYEEVAKEEG